MVDRPHLLDQLQDGRDGRLTLVAAPAGFGKTTLITSWINSVGDSRRFCWLALDEDDNDLQQFFRYVAAALQPLSESPLLLTRMSQAEQTVAAKSWAHALINDAVALQRPFALVLDDYHVIQTAAINDALNIVLDHMPPYMHLVITSRADPNLNIARLRARRQMTEIRAADLRLDTNEISALAQQLDLPVTEAQAALLNERTEGWIAGLQLAALAMQSPVGQHDPDEFIRTFAGSHRFVMDYLTDEVLRGQPLEVESFLLQTAILDRFNSDLCAAVLADERMNASAMLKRLEQANLFLVPLDGRRHWYRYHHLFADLLRQRLTERFSTDHITALHQRAIDWLCARERLDEAITHAGYIERWDDVVAAVTRVGKQMVYSGRYNRINAVLGRLPDAVLREQPRLAVIAGWLSYSRFDIASLQGWLPIAERLTDDPAHVGNTAMLRALLLLTTGNVAEAIEVAEAANSQLDERFPAEKGGLLVMLGNAYDVLGRTDARGEAFTQAVALLEKGNDWSGYAGGMTLLIRHHWAQGDLQTAWTLIQQFMDRYQADPRLQNGSGAQAGVWHALVVFERHDTAEFTEAVARVSQALEITRLTMVGTAIEIWMVGTLALLHIAKGETPAALKLALETDEQLTQMSPGKAMYGYYDFLIRVLLLLGQTDRARHWLDVQDAVAFEAVPSAEPNPATFINTVFRAQLQLLTDPNDIARLRTLRDRVRDIVDFPSTSYAQMMAPVTLALLEDVLGNHEIALNTMA
ncbi:MAG: hypothetical protein QNJ45_22830, partial [Ardenticatenaceae bacterium]|nr:hypothetical protein [Ardenticatenaceae bacterium]